MRPCAILLAALFVPALGAQEKKGADVMTAEQFVAIKTGRTPEAEAKKRWGGKTVEFTFPSWAGYQDLKDGKRAGQALVSFKVAEGGPRKRPHLLVAYFKGAKDKAALRDRPGTRKAPLKIRGKVVVDYKQGFRVWLDECEVVQE